MSRALCCSALRGEAATLAQVFFEVLNGEASAPLRIKTGDALVNCRTKFGVTSLIGLIGFECCNQLMGDLGTL